MPHRFAFSHVVGWTGIFTGGAGWLFGQALTATSTTADPGSVANAASYGGVILAAISFLTLAVNRYFDDRKAARDHEARITESERKIEEAHQAAKRVAREAADAKVEAARLVQEAKEEAARQIERLEAEDREKRHKLRGDFTARMLKLQADLAEEHDRRIQAEALHAAGINLNGAEIRKVADSLVPPVPVETLHIEPASGSGDDFPAIVGLGPGPVS
jgi:F0F1-type ATP synthase membrane subunit b/b'